MKLLLWFLLILNAILVSLNVRELLSHRAGSLTVLAIVIGSIAIGALSLAIYIRQERP